MKNQFSRFNAAQSANIPPMKFNEADQLHFAWYVIRFLITFKASLWIRNLPFVNWYLVLYFLFVFSSSLHSSLLSREIILKVRIHYLFSSQFLVISIRRYPKQAFSPLRTKDIHSIVSKLAWNLSYRKYRRLKVFQDPLT